MTDAATHLASCWHSEKIQLHAPLHVSNRYRDNEEFDDSTIVICMSRSVYSYATIVISFFFFFLFFFVNRDRTTNKRRLREKNITRLFLTFCLTFTKKGTQRASDKT